MVKAFMKSLNLPALLFCFSAAALLLNGCNTQKQVEMELRLYASLDKKPFSGARVTVDEAPAGRTDAQGFFSTRIKKLPGQEVTVLVTGQAEGYQLSAWRGQFVAKLPKTDAVERYTLDAELTGTRYFTLVVRENEQIVMDADIYIQGQKAGQSDAGGAYRFSYDAVPDPGFAISVRKQGYHNWEKTIRVQPGDRHSVALQKNEPKPVARDKTDAQPANKAAEAALAGQEKGAAPALPAARLNIIAQTDSYGVAKGLPGIVVRINGDPVGETDQKGCLTYRSKPLTGQKVKVSLQAAGFIPEQWETTITMNGRQDIHRYFYPSEPPVINVGVLGYRNTTPGLDLSSDLEAVENAMRSDLFRQASFKEVSKQQLQNLMAQNKLDGETLTAKGWRRTNLIQSVDMLVSGAMTRTPRGYTIETTVIAADGRPLLSQINSARHASDFQRTSRLIVAGIIDQFPFEGAITAVTKDACKINLGARRYNIRRGNQLRYLRADMDEHGKILGYREQGLLRVVKTQDTDAWTQIITLKDKHTIKVGDKIVRRIYLDEEREAAKATLTIRASGKAGDTQTPLWGVNVYLNNTWMGATESDGLVQIPVTLHDAYDVLLSRQGYQPMTATIDIAQKEATVQYTLQMANATLKIESDPPDADVFIDGVHAGRTPLLNGKLVGFGFRTLLLRAGGEYRDWRKVVEINQPEVDLTGDNRIILPKDWYAIGRTAEDNQQLDKAIQAYSGIERQNPDYGEARHRLARLYMDHKSDYDAAIREFENVLSLPENRQIIFKQYAVAYTNLGHAYYEKGNQLIWTDHLSAADQFAKAIEKLKIAKQNTRFFPNDQFNEAVHDTYYYLAIAYHKLYLVTKQNTLLPRADQAWREYFDFFPEPLEGKETFEGARKAAKQYWDQIKALS